MVLSRPERSVEGCYGSTVPGSAKQGGRHICQWTLQKKKRNSEKEILKSHSNLQQHAMHTDSAFRVALETANHRLGLALRTRATHNHHRVSFHF